MVNLFVGGVADFTISEAVAPAVSRKSLLTVLLEPGLSRPAEASHICTANLWCDRISFKLPVQLSERSRLLNRISFKKPAALSERSQLLRRQTLANFSQLSQPRHFGYNNLWHNSLLCFF